MGSFIFHTVFFLNFPLSGSWFCTLSRGQIDGSWFDHQKLWALLMGFYCVSISTHFVLFWHRGLRWPLYNPHSNPRRWHILSGLHWTTCSFQMWIPTQSVPRSSEKKSIIQHYNIQSWRGGYFPHISSFSKHILSVEYHVYIWQVSPQLSCGDTC